MAEEKLDVVEEGMRLAHLSSWKKSTNYLAYVRSLLEELQKSCDVFYSILANLSLDTNYEFMLDLLGEIAGEKRQGKTNREYRDAILAALARAYASGTRADIIQTVKLVTNASYVYVFDYFPASTYIFVPAFVSMEANKTIIEAHGGGIGTRVLWHEEPENLVFFTYEDDEGFDFEDVVLGLTGGNDFSLTGGESLYLASSATSRSHNTGLTSIRPGATSYDVVNSCGKLAYLVPEKPTPQARGVIIDHASNYIVDHNNNRIAYRE